MQCLRSSCITDAFSQYRNYLILYSLRRLYWFGKHRHLSAMLRFATGDRRVDKLWPRRWIVRLYFSDFEIDFACSLVNRQTNNHFIYSKSPMLQTAFAYSWICFILTSIRREDIDSLNPCSQYIFKTMIYQCQDRIPKQNCGFCHTACGSQLGLLATLM